jgi:hypothetical protein
MVFLDFLFLLSVPCFTFAARAANPIALAAAACSRKQHQQVPQFSDAA